MKNEIKQMLVRVKDLEVLLGVSKTTIWRFRQQPEIGFPKPVCIGSRIIGWKIEDIEIWIDNSKREEVAA